MDAEIESRYRVPAQALFYELAALPQLAGYVLQPLGSLNIRDRYLDTRERALLQEGWACRVRREQSATGTPSHFVTLKGPATRSGAILARPEAEVALLEPLEQSECWPAGVLRARVQALTSPRRLRRLATVRQRRYRYALMDGQRMVAELALDRIRFRAGKRSQRMYLVECELRPAGTREDLERVHQALTNTYGLVPEPRSKLRCALELRGVAFPMEAATAAGYKRLIGVCPEDDLRTAGRKVVCHLWEVIQAREVGTRVGADPEELHAMRVAARRMRSILRLLRPYLRSAHLACVEDAVRALARTLGDVRDMDVAMQRAQERQAQLSPTQAAELDRFMAAWAERHAAARQRLVAYLDGEAYRSLGEDMRTFLAELSSSRASEVSAETVYRLGPRYVRILRSTLRAYGAVLSEAPMALLHALRIDGKRLRYALEMLREGLPRRLGEDIPSVIALQDHLGNLNDACVAMQLIDETIAAQSDLGALAEVRAYREACLQDIRRLREEFPQAWKEFFLRR